MFSININISILLLIQFFRIAICDEFIITETNSGKIRGKLVENEMSKYYSFQGIPYAEPPERFKAAKPIEKWDGIKDALDPGRMCFQESKNKYLNMSEDCLFLNIYVPIDSDVKYPAMFWIHGGEFATGSGNPEVHGPEMIINENVIVVTMNYRLGAFGFLCADSKEAPGNIGLKDVLEALRWIKTNVAHFNGDPNKITIAGESAGSVIAHYILLAEKSEGLFDKAILSSGSALGYRFFTNSSVEYTLRLVKEMGFEVENISDAVHYLKTGEPSEIIEATERMGLDAKKGATLFRPFVPCAEENNKDAFLTEHPLSIVQSGNYAKVPILAGFNTDEGMKILPILLKEPGLVAEINEDFERVVPPDLSPDDLEENAVRIKSFYFEEKELTVETLPEYLRLITDVMFLHSIDYWLRSRVVHDGDVFYYEFTHDGAFNYVKLKIDLDYPGCNHADDLGYLWMSAVTKDIVLHEDHPSVVTRKRFVRMWTNFIKYGNPTPEFNDQLLNITWRPATTERMNYLEFGTELSAKGSPYRNRTKFWKDLYGY